jgi:hypothetical protein
MGTKRVGLARIQALMENLKRDLALGGSLITKRNAFQNLTTAAGNHDFTGLKGDTTILVSAAKADGTHILLPEATTENGGMHIRVVFGIAIADDFAVGFTATKIQGGAFAIGDTNEANAPTDIATAIADNGDNFLSVRFNLDTVAAAGGTGGTVLDFYYPGVASKVIYSGRLISEIDDPTLASHFSTSAANA